MRSEIQVGSAWAHKKSGSSIIVIAGNRTGHQYDRHWLFECLTSEGQIVEVEDYLLLQTYDPIKNTICEKP